MLEFLFQQIGGIPMGIKRDPRITNLFLYSVHKSIYEADLEYMRYPLYVAQRYICNKQNHQTQNY
jgi:hypothetical protein